MMEKALREGPPCAGHKGEKCVPASGRHCSLSTSKSAAERVTLTLSLIRAVISVKSLV